MDPTRTDIILAEQAGNVDALLRSLEAESASIRALALGSLSKIDALTSDHRHAALSDGDRNVRVRAVEVSIDDVSIDLVSLLEDDDDVVVETAAWALGERESASPDVITALDRVGRNHEVSICREAAIAALGAIGSVDGLPTILAGLDDRAPVRRRAVLALAPFDSPEVHAALVRALDDRDRQVRQAAEDLL